MCNIKEVYCVKPLKWFVIAGDLWIMQDTSFLTMMEYFSKIKDPLFCLMLYILHSLLFLYFLIIYLFSPTHLATKSIWGNYCYLCFSEESLTHKIFLRFYIFNFLMFLMCFLYNYIFISKYVCYFFFIFVSQAIFSSII